MPNHVRNVIKMQGITELPLFRTYDDGSKGLDFNKMIPMPESLNMDSGSMIDDYAIYYLTDRCTVPVSRVSAEKKAVITKMIANNMFGSEEWIQRIFNKVMERAFDETEAKCKKMYEDGKSLCGKSSELWLCHMVRLVYCKLGYKMERLRQQIRGNRLH